MKNSSTMMPPACTNASRAWWPAASPFAPRYLHEAIKVYREETGAGLKDAKDAVEAYEARG